MREIPALFNGAMVRAIQDDRKTQTRRPVKRQPPGVYSVVKWTQAGDLWYPSPSGSISGLPAERSPLGKPGDRLWVRETWAWPSEEDVLYFADPWARKLADEWKKDPNYPQVKWKPSIHMPRRFARLFLDVLDVRIERLQDISKEDARAEGVEQCGGFMTTSGCWMNYGKSGPSCKTARESFQTLWISVYGAESWAANPWVWVTTFRKVP